MIAELAVSDINVHRKQCKSHSDVGFDVYIIKHCKLVAAATKYASSLKYSSQFIPVYFSRNVRRWLLI